MTSFTWQQRVFTRLSLPEGAEKLLIEGTSSRPVLHALLLYGYIIAKAKNLKPVLIASRNNAEVIKRFAPQYLSEFEVVEPKKRGITLRVKLLLWAACFWLGCNLRKNLIFLRWRGELVGDIIYDQYLAAYRCATLHRWDPKLLRVIYCVIGAVEDAEALFLAVKPASLLLSHRVGLSAAPLAIVAERCGLPTYSFGGERYGTLFQSVQRKVYEYTAELGDLAPILALPQDKFEELFKSIQQELFEGAFNADSKLAFSHRVFKDRREFGREFGLDPAKKNVFIMLHAFTDYPHSHFSGMLFDDFYDWFKQTLDFSLTKSDVNWIVKQHPASRFYPVKDIDWGRIQAAYRADDIIFMPEGADFDTRSICYVGDAVITCLGSAGFELSAFAGIPSITASDNPYSHGGFAVVPLTKNSYFEVLANIGSIGRLAGMELQRAQATFMFIHRLSRVSMQAIPNITHTQQRTLQFDDRYFEKVAASIHGSEARILEELNRYIDDVATPDFRALRTIPTDYSSQIL